MWCMWQRGTAAGGGGNTVAAITRTAPRVICNSYVYAFFPPFPLLFIHTVGNIVYLFIDRFIK